MSFSASKNKLASMALLALCAFAAGGCNEGSKSTAMTEEAKPWYGGYMPHRGAPAPAPAPKAAAPAPAPAPVATGNCMNYRPSGAGMNVAELAFPTGDKRTSAVVLHQVMPAQVRAGANYDMEIHVTNITNATLQNVVVNGESIDNMTIVSSTPAAGRGAAGNAQWVIGDLGPCKTQVIKVNARADKVGTASNCLSVAYNNTLCAALNVVQPALQITKTMDSQKLLCDTITGSIEVKNTGSGVAENVVVRDVLAQGLADSAGKTGTLEFPLGNLAAGETKRIPLSLKASKTGRFENAATVAASGGLTASSGTVAVVVNQPTLALSIKCPERVFLGRPMKYEITVRNTGDTVCNNTTLTSTMPSGSSFGSASDGGAPGGSGVAWNLGTIPAGGSKTVTMELNGGNAGDFKITATVNCACANPATADCNVRLEGIPAILVECIDVDDPDEVGTDETYVITVTNQGTAPGTGIRVVAEIPAEMSFLSTAGATNSTVAGQTVTFAPLATLAPKAKAEWRVVVKCNRPGDVRFRIRVTSDQFSNPIEETESTNLYQ